MSLNLLVVTKREYVETLMPLFNINGTKATFLLESRTEPILRNQLLLSGKDVLVVLGDVLEDIQEFICGFLRTEFKVRLVIVTGVVFDPAVIIELCQKFETRSLYKTLYSYRPKLVWNQDQKRATEGRMHYQKRKRYARLLNGRILILNAEVIRVFDLLVSAKGRVVPWRVLRQYFNNRGTMEGAIPRLRQAIRPQYPGAEAAFVVHRNEGPAFDSTLLPVDKAFSAMT